MTDIIERMKEALGTYDRDRSNFDMAFADGYLSEPALTLLPEAMREIEELRGKLATATEALKRVSCDMNWQANSGERLNMFVFDYIDATLAEIKG